MRKRGVAVPGQAHTWGGPGHHGHKATEKFIWGGVGGPWIPFSKPPPPQRGLQGPPSQPQVNIFTIPSGRKGKWWRRVLHPQNGRGYVAFCFSKGMNKKKED